MPIYSVGENDDSWGDTIEAVDAASALELAFAQVELPADVDDFPYFCNLTVYNVDDDDDSASALEVFEQPEPDCTETHHHWIERSARLNSSGGGVTSVDTCAHCNLVRTSNTSAMNPLDGSHGHYVTTYQRGDE